MVVNQYIGPDAVRFDASASARELFKANKVNVDIRKVPVHLLKRPDMKTRSFARKQARHAFTPLQQSITAPIWPVLIYHPT